MRREKASQERDEGLKLLHQSREEKRQKSSIPKKVQSSSVQLQVGGQKSHVESQVKPQVKSEAKPQVSQVSQVSQARPQASFPAGSYEAQVTENREKIISLAESIAKFGAALAPAGVLSGLGAGGAVAGAAVGNAVSSDVAGLLASILDAINEISRLLSLYAPALQEIIKDLGPALKEMNDLVVEPYLGLVRDAKPVMAKFREDAVAGRLDPDALTPPITGPWQDWRRVAAVSTACSLPIAGDVFRADLNTVLMARYQSVSGRGWPSDYDMLAWASNQRGLFGPALDMADMIPAGKVPQWFLRN